VARAVLLDARSEWTTSRVCLATVSTIDHSPTLSWGGRSFVVSRSSSGLGTLNTLLPARTSFDASWSFSSQLISR